VGPLDGARGDRSPGPKHRGTAPPTPSSGRADGADGRGSGGGEVGRGEKVGLEGCQRPARLTLVPGGDVVGEIGNR